MEMFFEMKKEIYRAALLEPPPKITLSPGGEFAMEAETFTVLGNESRLVFRGVSGEIYYEGVNSYSGKKTLNQLASTAVLNELKSVLALPEPIIALIDKQLNSCATSRTKRELCAADFLRPMEGLVPRGDAFIFVSDDTLAHFRGGELQIVKENEDYGYVEGRFVHTDYLEGEIVSANVADAELVLAHMAVLQSPMFQEPLHFPIPERWTGVSK